MYEEKKWDSGKIQWQEWTNDEEKRHRPGGPAYLLYREDGSLAQEEWYIDGKRHRLDGPAYIRYLVDRRFLEEEWHIEGEQVPERGGSVFEWAKAINKELGYLPGSLVALLEEENPAYRALRML